MTRTIRINRLLLVAIVVAAVAWPLAQIASAGPGASPTPAGIAVPDGNKVFLVGHAVGVQIYSCTETPNGFSWAFVAPRAELFGDNGKLIATHFAGPTWQARDGSSVRGQVVSRATPDPTAIPWLLLSATSTAAGQDGNRLGETTYIQRLATTGGLAPSPAECNPGTVSTKAEIPYTADYYFWKATGDGGS